MSLQLVNSNGYEHPDPEQVTKMEEKQTRLLDSARESVAATINEQTLRDRFSVVKAFIHPAQNPRASVR